MFPGKKTGDVLPAEPFFLRRVYMHVSRVLYFKILHARQSKISPKLPPCTKPLNAACTAVFFSPENSAVHHTVNCYMHVSLIIIKNTTVHYTLKCYVHGSLFFTRNYCRAPYLKMLCVRQSSSRQYFEMPYFWKSKFWKKQLPPEFSMEMS